MTQEELNKVKAKIKKENDSHSTGYIEIYFCALCDKEYDRWGSDYPYPYNYILFYICNICKRDFKLKELLDDIQEDN